VERGRRRQACVWRGRRPDRVPILLGRSESRTVPDRVGPQHLRLCEHQLRGGSIVPEYHEFDHYTLREQFENPHKMLIESLWDMIGWSRTPSDAQLSFRPNYGVGTLASVFGCTIDMGENDMPWVKDRPSREVLLDLDLDCVGSLGLIPRVIEFIQMSREVLRGIPDVHLFMPDLQGPMNTMFLLRHEEAFIEMIEDPDYFHRLMSIITEVFIRLTRRLKAELGEPLDGGYHGAMYMENGGARVVDDVSIMISAAHYEEFSLPYVRKCLAPFGGGWVHSCGDISHQLRFYLEAPEIRGVNFGEPQYYRFEQLVPKFEEHHTFCSGGPVRGPDESVTDYLRRTARCVGDASQTLIFQPRMCGMDMSEGDWPEPQEMLDLWDHFCTQACEAGSA
jgi:uroporphyrinogen-III decarboxylase